jgi:hypothetical protein
VGSASWWIRIFEDRYSKHRANLIAAPFRETWNSSSLTSFPHGNRRPPHASPRRLATADKGCMNGTRNGSLVATGGHGTAKISGFVMEYSRLRGRQLLKSSLLQTTSFQECDSGVAIVSMLPRGHSSRNTQTLRLLCPRGSFNAALKAPGCEKGYFTVLATVTAAPTKLPLTLLASGKSE